MNKILLIGILFLVGCSVKNVIDRDIVLIDKEKNMCKTDSDCEYIWYTGGCNTPEYVAGIMEKYQDGSGPCPSEAPRREGVTCTCENNKCATHG